MIDFSNCFELHNDYGGSEKKKKIIYNEDEFKNKEYNTTLRYYNNGKKIFVHEFFKEPDNNLKEAIKRVFKNINLKTINEIIDNIETISGIRKEYLKKSIEIRYKKIIDPLYHKVKTII